MFFKKVFNKFLAIRFIIKYKAKKAILINPKNIKVGKNIHFGIYVKIACYERYATKQYFPTIEFGDNIYIGNFCSFLSASKLSIGDNSIIASYVLITNENHGSNLISDVPYKDQELITSDTLIGRNCWIGEKVTILKGVIIGDNVIVGANSVVTKNIPSNCIVAGNPARIIKVRNSDLNQWEKIDDYNKRN